MLLHFIAIHLIAAINTILVRNLVLYLEPTNNVDSSPSSINLECKASHIAIALSILLLYLFPKCFQWPI